MSKNKKPSQFYATASTSIVLVLISLFLLIFLHSTNITNIVKQNINILVELKNDLPQGEIDNITQSIEAFSGVLKESIEFLDKESALKLMNKEMNISSELEGNPFNDLIKFNLKSDQYSESKIAEIKKSIELEKGVISLYHENESLDMVQKNLERISYGVLVLALCFVILSLSIIYNTIQLTLYSDIKEIKTMQMVGAERSFIKKAYLREAFRMSVKSIAVMILFVLLLCFYLIYTNSIFAEILQWYYVVLTVLLSIFIAFFIQFSTTNRILNKFLKTEGG
ncbi:MAG TPA: permease-like cell division protein FtsX [Saprospiraceae bacterium]|nr:hypothetical protein [Saprospiraceae bacterium]HRO08767.1 permease-like cell division protein FtsX [Saprospiraceae bacterium]HRP41632.1 permease-like cell division protein FtsX [Saprospiraceae bacterium]